MRLSLPPELGPIIRRDRLKAEFAQEALARMISITPDQLVVLESGEIEIPYVLLLRAAHTLEVKPGKWFRELGRSDTDGLAEQADIHAEVVSTVMRQRRAKGA